MKLNIGCGLNRQAGYHNVDKYEACWPDQVMDAEVFPWPFEDSSVEAVLFNHSLEHMGRDPDVFLKLMQELYRVCRGGATVQINVPHPRHDNFINDPTHVRIVTPELLTLFSLSKCRTWQATGVANSQLAVYLEVDFELRHAQSIPDPVYQQAFDQDLISEAELRQMERSQNNVIREIRMTLEVIKP